MTYIHIHIIMRCVIKGLHCSTIFDIIIGLAPITHVMHMHTVNLVLVRTLE